MTGGWKHMLGLVALIWLATSNVIERLIPAPMLTLDVERLRAQVPTLVLTGDRPDLTATAAATAQDPEHPLAEKRLRSLGRLLDDLDRLRRGERSTTGLDRLLREQPPDPNAAVDFVGAWYDAAEVELAAGRRPEPPAMGRMAVAQARARPLAERMLHPLPLPQRHRISAALIAETLLDQEHP